MPEIVLHAQYRMRRLAVMLQDVTGVLRANSCASTVTKVASLVGAIAHAEQICWPKGVRRRNSHRGPQP
jgi:hypothetical protein